MLDRRLAKVQQRLARARRALDEARAEAAVLGEQGDEDALRALVSDNLLDASDSHETVRHASAARRAVERLTREVAELEGTLDRLLDERAAGR